MQTSENTLVEPDVEQNDINIPYRTMMDADQYRDAVGDLRLVRIETPGSDRPASDQIGLALDMLYDDVRSTIVRLFQGTSLGSRTGIVPEHQQVQDLVRPVMARMEEGWVSIWAHVNPIVWVEHAESGLHPFGPPLLHEPVIRNDARIVRGAEIDRQFELARDRIEAAYLRRVEAGLAQHRLLHRKIGLTTSILGIILVISLGAQVLGSLMMTALAVAYMAILHYSALVKSFANEPRLEHRSGRAMSIKHQPPVRRQALDDARQAVLRHAPAEIDHVIDAIGRIDRLETLRASSVDAVTQERILQVAGSVQHLVDTYRRPASLAVEDEAADLASGLADALTDLGHEADEIRMQALRSARNAFDTQRRYLKSRGRHTVLSPVC